MKILVLGASGMVGHLITRYFIEKGYDVTGFSRGESREWKSIIGDARDPEVIRSVLHNEIYDVVINCIGVLNQSVDRNLKDGIYLNSYLPHYVADLLRETPSKLIHLSTDCVFAGNTGPYDENSICDGISYYGRTKALGEVIDDRNLTFRMSVIGPDRNIDGMGLFHWFMRQEHKIRGYTRAMWTGVTTLTLAEAMEHAIQEDLCGLYHLVNSTSISKYELCLMFNQYFRDGSIEIEPYDGVVLDKTLINNRSDFSFHVPCYECMIAQMREWGSLHREDYSFYNIDK